MYGTTLLTGLQAKSRKQRILTREFLEKTDIEWMEFCKEVGQSWTSKRSKSWNQAVCDSNDGYWKMCSVK